MCYPPEPPLPNLRRGQVLSQRMANAVFRRFPKLAEVGTWQELGRVIVAVNTCSNAISGNTISNTIGSNTAIYYYYDVILSFLLLL